MYRQFVTMFNVTTEIKVYSDTVTYGRKGRGTWGGAVSVSVVRESRLKKSVINKDLDPRYFYTVSEVLQSLGDSDKGREDKRRDGEI